MEPYKNCTVIGVNAFSIMDGQVVIGNFTEDERLSERYNDCYIFNEGQIIIKKDVVEFLLGKVEEGSDLSHNTLQTVNTIVH